MKFLRPTTMSDLEFVAANMREEDIEECAAGALSPYDALLIGYENGPCFSLLSPAGEPVGLVGVNGQLIWLLGTPGIERFSVTFLRHSKEALHFLYEVTGQELFWNHSYCHNHLHHKWLRWLGFSFLRKVGQFYEFARLRGG